MTFSINENAFSRRREGTTSISASTMEPSAANNLPWKNTGAGGAFEFYGNTSSYIQYQNNGEFNFGYGDFTIEWWQYETDTNGAPRPWAFGPWPQTQLGVSMEGNIYLWVDGNAISFTPVAPVKNATNHFAIVKSGSEIFVYQNGIKLGAGYYVGSLGFNMGYPLTIGSESGQYDSQCFAGTITNFNIEKIAKYTAPFVPTKTALTFSWDTNIFLAPFDNGQRGATPVGPYFDPNNAAQYYLGNVAWLEVSPFSHPHPAFPDEFPYAPVNGSCYRGGGLDGNGMCVLSYPAAQTTVNWTFNNQGNRWFVLRDYSGFWMSGGGTVGLGYANNSFRVFHSYEGYWLTGWLTVPELVSQGWLIPNNTYVCAYGGTDDGSGNCIYPHDPLPTVTGGVVTASGDYFYRTFTASDTLSISSGSLDAEVLLVAGGGGGGNGGGYESGGGGGAGGVLHIPSLTIPSGSRAVVVGNGGSYGANGGDSYINGVGDIAYGGGYGGPYGGAGSGGSGGGAPGWGAYTQFGNGVPGQGNPGGYGTYAYSQSGAGGGGGAFGVGGNAQNYGQSGRGGDGTPLYTAWGGVTGVGSMDDGTNYRFGAGGGGGSGWYNSVPANQGGLGGGGNGGYWDPQNGVATSGSGGGGSNNDHAYAGNGGSGVVILKYLKSAVA